MNRRKFLQRAALGSVALGSLPALGGKALADGDDGRRKGYHFVVRSIAPGTPPEVLIISGQGTFDSNGVDGGGHFDHFHPAAATPFPIVATGTWKAKKLVSFTIVPGTPAASNPEGRHGVYQAGVLILKADFHPIGKKTLKDVSVEVVCNLGPAGASTPGLEEGVYVTAAGLEFEPSNVGVTIFTASDNESSDD